MVMISYAQNMEDVRLARVFGQKKDGFYVDVGAYDPFSCSITRWFYDLGWRGLNLEPAPGSFAKVAAARPRDTNLNVGISNKKGAMRFFDAPTDAAGLSTLNADVAAKHKQQGASFVEREVEVTTLADVCARYAPPEIDFLSIDVEGHEREVLEGADFVRFRPRVVIVEATEPKTQRPTHEAWEPILLAADYVYAAFDGLNRYYVRKGDEGIIDVLAGPPTCFDEFLQAPLIAEIERLNEIVGKFKNEESQLVRGVKRWDRFYAKLKSLTKT